MHCIYLNQPISYYYVKTNQNFFPVNLSKQKHIIYGRRLEWSTVEAEVTYINKYIKEL